MAEAKWMQCTTPFPGNFGGIQEPFELIFLNARGIPDMALFTRTTQDGKEQVFLITPEVVRRRPDILKTGDWRECINPASEEWTLLVGIAGAHERFGLRRPNL